MIRNLPGWIGSEQRPARASAQDGETLTHALTHRIPSPSHLTRANAVSRSWNAPDADAVPPKADIKLHRNK